MLQASPTSRRRFLGLLPATLIAAPALAQDSKSSLRSATVVFVRHAEKAKSDSRDPSISERGKQRATALAELLQGCGVTHLFCTELKRTRETLIPLAERFGLELTEYPARDPRALTTKLAGLAGGEVIVVAGHSNTVPQMAQLMGGELAGLDERGFLGEDEYDRVVVQTIAAAGAATELCAIQTLDLRSAIAD